MGEILALYQQWQKNFACAWWKERYEFATTPLAQATFPCLILIDRFTGNSRVICQKKKIFHRSNGILNFEKSFRIDKSMHVLNLNFLSVCATNRAAAGS